MLMVMGRNNQQRRAAKARARHRFSREARPPTPPGSSPLDDRGSRAADEQRDRLRAYELLQDLARTAAWCPAGALRDVLRELLAPVSTAIAHHSESLLIEELSQRVDRAWVLGWEPRDVMHVATRINRRVAAQVLDLVVHQSRTGTSDPASTARLAQVAHLRHRRPDWTWRPVYPPGTASAEELQNWSDALLLVKLLAELGPLSGTARSGAASKPGALRPPDPERDRLLHKVRSLLAKAEATEFSGEAETFTAKAQQLMSRHAIDEAMLRRERAERVDVVSRRVHLQAPYASVKASLLHAVAEPNRCRTVLHSDYDIATLVGTPLAIEQVEMLFTSLLVQATRAMAEAGRRPGSYDRSTSFRRSFLMSYAVRIGERLGEADQTATREYGTELVPLLRRETEAVDAEYERLFPDATRGRAARFDASGWSAGRAAADRATFVSGKLSA